MKQCTKCKKRREESEFSKNRSRKDGLSLWCKDCERAYMRERCKKEGKAEEGVGLLDRQVRG